MPVYNLASGAMFFIEPPPPTTLRAVTDLHTVAELSRPQLNKKTQAEGRFSADTPTHTCSQSEVRILYPSVFLRL